MSDRDRMDAAAAAPMQSTGSGAASARTGQRRPVATYDTYAQAQGAVDTLSDRRFPVERLQIVGEDLRLVEQVTGRRTWGRVAGEGLVNGALTGAFIGFLFGLFSLFDPLVSAVTLALWGAVIGAVLGLVFALLAHALTGGRRDFSSQGGMQAARYVILADEDVADDAARILAESPGSAR